MTGKLEQARAALAERGMQMQRTVEIADDSFEAMQRLAAELGWGDGLPLVAPTEARVEAMLGGRDPNHVLGVMPPRHAEVTNLAVAANAVMAGCPPSVFPVVTTAIRAMCLSRFNLEGVQTTTHPVAPLVIVHGEIVDSGRFQRGFGHVRPRHDRQRDGGSGGAAVPVAHRRRATGRGRPIDAGTAVEVRVLHGREPPGHTVGALPGVGRCLRHERGDGGRHENPHNVENHVSGHAPSLLTTIASVFATIGSNNTWVHDGEVFIVLCPEHAQSIAGDGWTRRDVQDFLFNEAQLPLERLHYLGYPDYTDDQRRARLAMWPRWMRDLEPDDRRVPLVTDPVEVSYRGRRWRRQAFVGHPELGTDGQRHPAARRMKEGTR